METTVISVRIRKEIKEELQRAGVDISKEVRKFLEDLARRKRLERELEEVKRILSRVKPSPRGFSRNVIREERRSH